MRLVNRVLNVLHIKPCQHEWMGTIEATCEQYDPIYRVFCWHCGQRLRSPRTWGELYQALGVGEKE